MNILKTNISIINTRNTRINLVWIAVMLYQFCVYERNIRVIINQYILLLLLLFYSFRRTITYVSMPLTIHS